ncbi:MAG TPA: cytochrome P450 [Casimicrobiaceae bacterium]
MTTGEMVEAPRAHCPIEAEVGVTFGQWLGERSVYWSTQRNAWIVTGYAESARILEESGTFWRDIPQREGGQEFWGRHLLMLEGRDHRRMHAVHMQLTGETFAEDIRERARELAREVSARLVKQGRAELAADYADTVPFLIGCDFLGLNAADASLSATLLPQMKIRAKWKEALHSGDGISLNSKIAQDGQAALRTMASVLLPVIRDRREHPREDLISAIWRKGPSVFPDWNEHDVLSTIWSSLDNETKPLLRGLVYTLCRDAELQATLRRDPSRVESFVEEGLRFLTPFRTIRRFARKDVEIGGQTMRSGDSIYVITPLANRDEERWACPHAFDAERTQESTHLAFGYGPGYCVGRYVGRVEAAEAVRALLAETSSFGLDPESAKPEWAGEMYHSVSPIHAILQR